MEVIVRAYDSGNRLSVRNLDVWCMHIIVCVQYRSGECHDVTWHVDERSPWDLQSLPDQCVVVVVVVVAMYCLPPPLLHVRVFLASYDTMLPSKRWL